MECKLQKICKYFEQYDTTYECEHEWYYYSNTGGNGYYCKKCGFEVKLRACFTGV